MITELRSVDDFQELLNSNQCLVIIKFGAEWCGPCKDIEKDVHDFFVTAPKNVQCLMVDIDKFPTVYGFLKTKKMVNGIPAILCYHKGNLNYVPDDFVIGSNRQELYNFFDRCVKYVIEHL
jgi:thioredoxin-like negative regulator of GroEL